MSSHGHFEDGAPSDICREAWRLSDLWLKSNWNETTPKYGDIFDNPEGRAYWEHREACDVCTSRKERKTMTAKLVEQLGECESALISMVKQYCDESEYDGATIYGHRFMSAGEEAFAYLVGRGLARWVDGLHSAIVFVKDATHD